MIDSHSFGSVVEGDFDTATISGSYTPAVSGLYTLEIENTRGMKSESTLTNVIDTIMLNPVNPMLAANRQTFPALFARRWDFTLNAGVEHANRDYWLWIGFSGTWPGINKSGVNVPLNYDLLVRYCLTIPGFPAAGFSGKLDAAGRAYPSLTWHPDLAWQGLTLWMAYVVLSPGGGLPLLAASNPINGTVTYFY